MERFELMFDFKEFWCGMTGFIIYQTCAYVLATYAQKHSLLTDLIVRGFYIVIQIILLLIFESKMHFFQYKVLGLMLLNGFLILFSVQINPVATLVILHQITWLYFNKTEKMIEDKIIKAFKNDINLDFYDHNRHMANRNRENAVPAGEDLPLPHVDNSSNELAGQI